MPLHFNGYRSEISWQLAQSLIHNYNQNPDRLKVMVNNVEMTLSGFSFPRAEVEALLSDSSVEKVFLAMGYHDGSDPNTPAGATTIMMGMKTVNNALYLMKDTGDKIYDFCEPCPTHCPANVN